MAYTKTAWVNDGAPNINAENLNKIEKGIEDAHNMAGGLDESGVRATLMTGLISVNGTPTANDSLLVAIGKLKHSSENKGGSIESFDVPINNGWQANLDDVPSSLQVFRKQEGTVVSNGIYLVQDPSAAGAIIATLPVALRPSYRVKGTAFANVIGTLTPVPFYIETNGEFGILVPQTSQFTLFLDLIYFV